ncbi:MAG: hypothetical protein A2521_00370 [Deltaproteobacteria bacterium RIFOXYD12_FULL_57_12]|nr:MAG: hypothetical protein A2521_00370 [Deltaproteobacteria bacterium RIFOXYD12_FULL_57_12]
MQNDWFGQRGRRLFVTLITAVLLAGCARTEPVSYYQLSARRDAIDIPESGAAGRGRTFGLGPVRLPEYLERAQIVSRASANRLELADSQRWAEPLAEGIPRVLVEDLAFLLDHDRVLRHPWPRSQAVDCQVVVEMVQFEAGPERAATLTARWTVLDNNGTMLLAERRSSFQVAAAAGQEGLVAALSDALWRLAREIAVGLNSRQDRN